MVKKINKPDSFVEFIMDNRDCVLEVVLVAGEKVIIYPNMVVNALYDYIHIVDEDDGIQTIFKVDAIVCVSCGG